MKRWWEIRVGDVLDELRKLPDESVQCCVTSPPYWGLRDYGTAGQMGQEPTPGEHVAVMVEVFREVRRVLRDDGTLWLNYGDCYAGSGGAGGDYAEGGLKAGQPKYVSKVKLKKSFRRDRAKVVDDSFRQGPGLKPKDLVGMPWRVALALQADGWWLRGDIVWHKPNSMPESAPDRPSKSHEYVFLLSKLAHYFYDNEAIKEPAVDGDPLPPNGSKGGKRLHKGGRSKQDIVGKRQYTGFNERYTPVTRRNCRDVWTIATKPYKGAHFATFPPKLPRRCIKAGTSERGCCSVCGVPMVRVVEKTGGTTGTSWHDHACDMTKGQASVGVRLGGVVNGDGCQYATSTIAWRAGCDCGADTVPCVVLDPFSGAGTTGVVAVEMGRRYIGIEINPEYAAMSERRIAEAAEPGVHVAGDMPAGLPLFDGTVQG